MILDALDKTLKDAREEMYKALDAGDVTTRDIWYSIVIKIQEVIVQVERVS